MTLSDLASLGSLVSSIAVLLTLVFLLIQTRQNTVALSRAEAIAAQTAASPWRMAIVNDKDVARVIKAGYEDGDLDQIDEIRYQTALNEIIWFSALIWQREQIGLFPPGDWERTGRAMLPLLVARRGAVWWDQNKASFPPGFSEDLDKIIAAQRITPPSPAN